MRNALLSLTLLAAAGCSLTIDPDGVEPPVPNKTVQSIAVTPTAPATLTVPKGAGAAVQLIATATYTDSTTGDVTATATWSSATTSVATVSNSAGTKGLVTAVADSGTSVITATLQGVSGTATVIAAPHAVTSIAVTPAAPSVVRGLTTQLTATATYSDATTGNVTSQATWTSADDTIVAVSDVAGTKGLATAVATGGPVTITATDPVSGKSGAATVTVTPPAVTSIVVTPLTSTIIVGSTPVQLTAVAVYDDSTTEDVTASATWTSGTPGVAAVDDGASKGRVTGVSAGGPVTISAAFGSKTGTASVSVKAAGVTVTSIDVAPVAPATLTVPKGVNGAVQLAATAHFSDLTTGDVTGLATWTSGTPSVATVSDVAGTKGLVTAVAASGTSVITATYGVSGTATVTAAAAEVFSIAVTPASTTLPKGAKQQLTAIATYTDGTTLDVTSNAATTWVSGLNSVATVSTTGEVTGAATTGSATITASFGGKSGAATISAAPAAVSTIAVTPSSATVAVGGTQQLTAIATYTDATTLDVTSNAATTWTSSATGVATVSASGLVTGVATSGNTTITAAYGGKQGTASITAAAKAVQSIEVTPATSALSVGEVVSLVATAHFTDSSTAVVTTDSTTSWQSSASGVATVSNSGSTKGKVTGVSVSATPVTITATYGGKSGTATVTVSPISVQSITITPASPVTAVGGTVQLIATATYTDSTTADVTDLATWASGNTGVATVLDAGTKGLVTGVSAAGGTATASISASLDGQVGSKIVTVKTVASMAVSGYATPVPWGKTVQLTATATLTGGGTQDVTANANWSSGNAAIATVSNTAGTKGLVTAAAGAGTATISAVLGVTGTTSVTVADAEVVSIAVTGYSSPVPWGRTVQLIATATMTGGPTRDLTADAGMAWSTSASGTAIVSTSGLVTAKAANGSATITATYTAPYGTPAGSQMVTVAPAVVDSVAVSPMPPATTLDVAKGLTLPLQAVATYSNLTTADVTSDATWAPTSGSTIATVSDTGTSKGLVTALGVGQQAITATFFSVSGNATVNVGPATLESLAITPAPILLAKGAHQQLVATGTYSDDWQAPHKVDHTADASFTVAPTVPQIARVGNTPTDRGILTAVDLGSTTFAATVTVAGVTRTSPPIDVTVSSAALVKLTVAVAFLGTDRIPPGTFLPTSSVPISSGPYQAIVTATWSDGRTLDVTLASRFTSSNDTVMSVSNDTLTRGQVTAKTGGPASLSAIYGGLTATVDCTVRVPVVVYVAPMPTGQIPLGVAPFKLTAMAIQDDFTFVTLSGVTWSSSDETVAKIAPDGTPTGVSPSATGVTITATDVATGISGSVVLYVASATRLPDPMGFFISPNPVTIPYGRSKTLRAFAVYDDGRSFDVGPVASWIISDPTLFVPTPDGELAATRATGSCTLTATFDGSTATAVAQAGLDDQPWIQAPDRLPLGQSVQLRAYIADRDTGLQLDVTDAVAWRSISPGVATVSDTSPTKGLVTAGTTAGLADIEVRWGADPDVGPYQRTRVTVDVRGTLVEVQLNATSAVTLPIGGWLGLTATALYDDSTTSDVTQSAVWSTGGSTAVAFYPGAPGLVMGVAGGTGNVTASFGGATSPALRVDVLSSPVATITVSPSYAAAPAGVPVQFTAMATLEDFTTVDVTGSAFWLPADWTVADLSYGSGSFGGSRPGSTQIYATVGTAVGFADLDVTPAEVTGLGLIGPSPAVNVGTDGQMTAVAYMSDGSMVDVSAQATWVSSNTAIATVSGGLVSGVASGSVDITATYGGFSGTQYGLIVGPFFNVSALTLTPNPYTVYPGDPSNVVLTLSSGGVTFNEVAEWSSSDPAIADVSNTPGQKGRVYGFVPGGQVTITATYRGGTAYATVNVAAPYFDVTYPTMELRYLEWWDDPQKVAAPCQFGQLAYPTWVQSWPAGYDVQFFACARTNTGRLYDLTEVSSWSATSSIAGALQVSDAPGSKGRLTTVGPASSGTITASYVTAIATQVEVNAGTLSSASNDGGPGYTHLGGQDIFGISSIKVRASYSDGRDADVTRFATVTSSDPATVAVGGLDWQGRWSIQGLRAGTAALTIDYHGVKTVSSLRVDDRVYAFLRATFGDATDLLYVASGQETIVPWKSLPVGMSAQAQLLASDAIGLPWSATEQATWTSSNPGVASVSNVAGSRGRVTAVAPGYATITGTAEGLTASLDVEVNVAALTSFAVLPNYDLGPSGVVIGPFQAVATYSDGSSFDVTNQVTWPVGARTQRLPTPGSYRINLPGVDTLSVTHGGATASFRIVGY